LYSVRPFCHFTDELQQRREFEESHGSAGLLLLVCVPL